MRALAGLDLRVARGTVFGLLGPNGAGKTTLVKLALGIAFPTGGRAEILGRPAGDVGARARVGYLPENHRYPAHLTGAQVLDFFGALGGIPAADRRRRVTALLEKVRLSEWAGVAARKYSKGMMQRLGLAQAILNEPDLLILDEPTDGVDPVGRREIRDLLLEQKARGATIFLNSHLLSEVERVCDRVAILKEGRLVREGSVADLTRVSASWEVEVRGADARAIADAAARASGEMAVAAPPASAPAAGPVPPPAGPPPASPPPGAALLEVRGDVAALNRCLDLLRSRGLLIAGVKERRESLEDVFVRVVRDGEAA